MSKLNDEVFEKVYDVVAGIPEGKVMSYGQIADIIGYPRAARMVGFVMNKTPRELEIPAHRVVRADGGLAPAVAFGGVGVQKEMLLEEGVVFKKNGKIDMNKSRL